jgi:hypothetical protein
VVSDAPLHHSPLELPTLFYDVLLPPTLPHSWPHHRSLFAVVKRKKGCALKKVEHNDALKYEENYRDMLCAPWRRKSIPSVRVPPEQTWIPCEQTLIFAANLRVTAGLRKPMPRSMARRPPRTEWYRFSPFLCPATRAMLRSTLIPRRSAAHGMDHTSARRDRPELRNQLVRQRRTLVRHARFCSARFLKRFLYISSLPSPLNYRHGLSCVHAH